MCDHDQSADKADTIPFSQPPALTGADRERFDALGHPIKCASCKCDSGIEGQWKNRPALGLQLLALGWACLHAGHPRSRDLDPRAWVCPACIPSWRDGHAARDLERLAQRTQKGGQR